MSILSTIKKVLGRADDLQPVLALAGLLAQKIEDTTLTGAEKLAWVKNELEKLVPTIAPKIAKDWDVNWPKVDRYITILVATAKLVGLFARSVK